MINIVQPFFRRTGRPRHISRAVSALMLSSVLTPIPAAMALPLPAGVGPLTQGGSALFEVRVRRFRHPAPACDPEIDCPGRRPPGAPDVDARPFEGTLGRPCAYRYRYESTGTRRVRVCF